jgi:hypothetical protein
MARSSIGPVLKDLINFVAAHIRVSHNFLEEILYERMLESDGGRSWSRWLKMMI